MPVCDHKRQYLTALASEDDLIFTGRTVYFPKSVFTNFNFPVPPNKFHSVFLCSV